MKYQAILFDMDGTLVPMDIQRFTKGYFQLLFRKLPRHGLESLLITDWMIPFREHPWNGPKGSFSETTEMLKALEPGL